MTSNSKQHRNDKEDVPFVLMRELGGDGVISLDLTWRGSRCQTLPDPDRAGPSVPPGCCQELSSPPARDVLRRICRWWALGRYDSQGSPFREGS